LQGTLASWQRQEHLLGVLHGEEGVHMREPHVEQETQVEQEPQVEVEAHVEQEAPKEDDGEEEEGAGQGEISSTSTTG
jgi:hypothetical protein